MASMLNACPEANAEREALFRLTCYEIKMVVSVASNVPATEMQLEPVRA